MKIASILIFMAILTTAVAPKLRLGRLFGILAVVTLLIAQVAPGALQNVWGPLLILLVTVLAFWVMLRPLIISVVGSHCPRCATWHRGQYCPNCGRHA